MYMYNIMCMYAFPVIFLTTWASIRIVRIRQWHVNVWKLVSIVILCLAMYMYVVTIYSQLNLPILVLSTQLYAQFFTLYAFNIDEQIVNYNGITLTASIAMHVARLYTYIHMQLDGCIILLLHDVNFNNIFPIYIPDYTMQLRTCEMNITKSYAYYYKTFTLL